MFKETGTKNYAEILINFPVKNDNPQISSTAFDNGIMYFDAIKPSITIFKSPF